MKIEPSEDIGDLVVPMSVELSFATTSKVSDTTLMEQVLALAIEDVQKRFEKDGFKLYIRAGNVRPMTQEELLTLIPRKIHMADGVDGAQICTTPHVSAKNLTTDASKVTCKLCLKALK